MSTATLTRVVNDWSIQVATVNGSGSQSSNNILMRSIFRMGVPVSGKNLFPSNIAGLPTWFTIRANKDGWTARKKEVDLLVAMNSQTVHDDVAALKPGAAVVHHEEFKLGARDDLIYYPVPFNKLVASCCPDAKLRKLVVNMIYVGVVAQLLGIDEKIVDQETRKQFGKKLKALELNLSAIRAGAQYAKEHLEKLDPLRVEPLHATEGKIIIEGNQAAALGAVFGGCTVLAWYPITPSSSLAEAAIGYFQKYRKAKDGKNTYAVVQAEDEIAAIGMVLGAGWAGARAMTNTSGPGISLMAEFAGLGYFAEVPGVIVDVQRVGPSTGLPTRTMQGDILEIAFLSHGDTKHMAVIPGSVEECFTLTMEAFDLAERFQTPVFVITDLDLGMNNWMSDPFPYPTKPLDRGKVLTTEDLDRVKDWARYKDVDGDGVPFRTLPGTPHKNAGYFTRGSGHNERAEYTEKPSEYVKLIDRLGRKVETAKKYVPQPVVRTEAGARIGLVAYGTSDFAVEEARHLLRKEQGWKTDYLRIRALPLTAHVAEFVRAHERVYVVEQNRDGQMEALIRLEAGPDAGKIRHVRHYNGLPIDARTVVDAIVAQEKDPPPPAGWR